MPRYAKLKAGWIADDTYSDDCPLVPDLHIPEHQPIDTGLLYPDGQPIMRLPNEIGFHANID